MSEIIKEVIPEDTDHTPEAIPAGKQPFILTETPSISVCEDPSDPSDIKNGEFTELKETEAPADNIGEPEKEVHIPVHRHFTEEEKSEAFHAVKKDLAEHSKAFSPADEIASRITEDHITEYLEGSREARTQHFKEEREKRILTAFELAAALASVVLVVYFLKDNPAILVNILYIIGALAGLWLWKKPHNHSKDDKKDE